MKKYFLLTCTALILLLCGIFGQKQSVPGYKGIWFTLGQFSEYGDKYSGGLGTYTAKHIPMAVFSAKANKTFFVYGGTTHADERKLRCMIGCYDHTTQKVQKPVVVYDKGDVDDPHDNPTISIDNEGYLWVFVSGRGIGRPGVLLKSRNPNNIEGFDVVLQAEFTYPQPKYIQNSGFVHLFTKYTGLRELYFQTSKNGVDWAESVKLVGIKRSEDSLSGHYQISGQDGNKIGFFYNWHPNGDVDRRTNIYYIQTTDFGKTWTTVDGKSLSLPVTEVDNPSMVREFFSLGKNVYIKDIAYDSSGHPVCLYLCGIGHQPGPENGLKKWAVIFWNGSEWVNREVTTSDHNYDTGSLWVEDSVWTIIAPLENSPQPWGCGGEIVIWKSYDKGNVWVKYKHVTHNSIFNHNYVRKVVHGVDPFLYFWADGDPTTQSKSELFFGNSAGEAWKLPYEMTEVWERPKKLK